MMGYIVICPITGRKYERLNPMDYHADDCPYCNDEPTIKTRIELFYDEFNKRDKNDKWLLVADEIAWLKKLDYELSNTLYLEEYEKKAYELIEERLAQLKGARE